MPYKNGKYYDNGKSSICDDVRDGVVQGVKDFFKNPVKETLRAQEDFSRAGDLSSGLTNSGGSGGSGNGGSNKKNNGAANWSKNSK